MCLSTVYKNTMEPASIAMKNVMRIECKDGCVILTDLMDRSAVIEGELEQADLVDGKVQFQAESDALIVKGIVALLLRVFNNQSPKDILDADLYFIEQIGLREHLSPTRSNGLLAMLKQMKMYALVFSQRQGLNLT